MRTPALLQMLSVLSSLGRATFDGGGESKHKGGLVPHKEVGLAEPPRVLAIAFKDDPEHQFAERYLKLNGIELNVVDLVVPDDPEKLAGLLDKVAIDGVDWPTKCADVPEWDLTQLKGFMHTGKPVYESRADRNNRRQAEPVHPTGR